LLGGELEFHEREYQRLVGLLEESAAARASPEAPSARPALHDLLVRLLLGLLPRPSAAQDSSHPRGPEG